MEGQGHLVVRRVDCNHICGAVLAGRQRGAQGGRGARKKARQCMAAEGRGRKKYFKNKFKEGTRLLGGKKREGRGPREGKERIK